MLIAQISDLHITATGPLYDRVDTQGFLKRAIAHLNALSPQPDVVLATGDLVDQGTVAEYAMLATILAPLRAPVYLALGNHDDRTAFRQVFGDRPYVPTQGPIQYAIDGDPVRILVLDTLVPGASHGTLSPATCQWVADELARHPHQPTVITLHHPPFMTGLSAMDRINCQDGEALGAIVSQWPQVERVICGHVHRAVQVRWAGTLGSIAPSVAHQVALRLNPAQSNGLTFEPPAFSLHLWQPATGLITHTVPIGEFETHDYRALRT
jgi:3',5'-cyclic AMP phosphodiesterase CpdA